VFSRSGKFLVSVIFTDGQGNTTSASACQQTVSVSDAPGTDHSPSPTPTQEQPTQINLPIISSYILVAIGILSLVSVLTYWLKIIFKKASM
jgi:hypothetical protein